MNIHNSQNITLDKVGYSEAEVLLNVTGEKSTGILLSDTNTKKAKNGIEFRYAPKRKPLS